MIAFAAEHKEVLEGYDLIGTGTTGKLINEKTGLNVHNVPLATNPATATYIISTKAL